MKRKKVCIIRSNPVRPDSRVEKEALSLSLAGYDVCVLAWDRDHDHEPSYEYLDLNGKRIPITRLGFKATFGEGFKNIIPYLKFQSAMRKFIRKNDFDIVHACDFDTAFFSQNIVRRKGEKFVFDIFDFLYCDPKNILQRTVKKAQIRLINKSDTTIICTEDRRNQICGSHPSRLEVIHNTPMVPKTSETFGFDENISKNKVSVVYVGILQDHRLLKEIASYFKKHPDVEWHVGGFGKYEDFIKELSDTYENIKFYGRISYDKTIALESFCDICLAVYDPFVDNHKYAAPNKFYESLMLGKPVVMVKGTGMSEKVCENGIGVLIDYSEEGFEEGMNALLSKRDEWHLMAEKMKDIYRREYSWDIMEKRLRGLYESL